LANAHLRFFDGPAHPRPSSLASFAMWVGQCLWVGGLSSREPRSPGTRVAAARMHARMRWSAGRACLAAGAAATN